MNNSEDHFKTSVKVDEGSIDLLKLKPDIEIIEKAYELLANNPYETDNIETHVIL